MNIHDRQEKSIINLLWYFTKCSSSTMLVQKIWIVIFSYFIHKNWFFSTMASLHPSQPYRSTPLYCISDKILHKIANKTTFYRQSINRCKQSYLHLIGDIDMYKKLNKNWKHTHVFNNKNIFIGYDRSQLANM